MIARFGRKETERLSSFIRWVSDSCDLQKCHLEELTLASGGNTDHPHAGGEHIGIALPAHCRRGPSPRGWGAPQEVFRTMFAVNYFQKSDLARPRAPSRTAEVLNNSSNVVVILHLPLLPRSFVPCPAIPEVGLQKVTHPFQDFAISSNQATISSSGSNPKATGSGISTPDSESLTLVLLKLKRIILIDNCYYSLNIHSDSHIEPTVFVGKRFFEGNKKRNVRCE